MCEDMYEVYISFGELQKTEQLLATMVDLKTATLIVQAWFAENCYDQGTDLIIRRMPEEKYDLVQNWRYYTDRNRQGQADER